ncbi:MAG: universal stress protein [Actinomycetota bacterium]|nr:universal stress protein [Coriobacteriia bacterium]MDP2233054.1 universal stress protein [Actinomycetota bacterium]
MLRSVMIPADFTPESALILRFAEGLPALGVKRVVLGHVVEASGLEGPVIAAKVDKACDDIRALTGRLVEAGLDVETRVGTGDPAQGLLALATESYVAAVVCGTHGRGIISKLISGSVAEEIAVEANVPTMLVRFDLLRTREEPSSFARDFGKQVLLPIDFSSSSTRALMSVLELPRGSVGMLYLMHVLDPGLHGGPLERAREGAGFQLDNLRKIAEDAGVQARCVVKQGPALRSILQEANERRVTGIVVGTRGQNPLQEAVLGSTSMAIVRQASAPVLIVP